MDSGADVSVLPAPRCSRTSSSCGTSLISADGTSIPALGTVSRNLHLLSLQASHTFLLAATNRTILGRISSRSKVSSATSVSAVFSCCLLTAVPSCPSCRQYSPGSFVRLRASEVYISHVIFPLTACWTSSSPSLTPPTTTGRRQPTVSPIQFQQQEQWCFPKHPV